MNIYDFIAAAQIHTAQLQATQPESPYLYLRVLKDRRTIKLETTVNGDAERHVIIEEQADGQISDLKMVDMARKLRLNAAEVMRLTKEIACPRTRPTFRKQWPAYFEQHFSKR